MKFIIAACQPFYFIFQENFAVPAELIRFAVDIALIPAVMHQAGMFAAVAQSERVPQFVDGLFDNSAEEGLLRVQGAMAFVESNR